VRIALGQINSTVGDVCRNAQRMVALGRAAHARANLADRRNQDTIPENVLRNAPSF